MGEAAKVVEFTDEELGNTLSPEELAKHGDTGGIITLPEEFSPDFLAELAKLAPEDKAVAEKAETDRIAAEKEAADKAAADKAEADRLAAETLAAEEKEFEGKVFEGKVFIPKGRFNIVNEKAKRAGELEDENKKLKDALEALQKGTAPSKEEPAPDPRDILEEKVVELHIITEKMLIDFGVDSVEYKDSIKAYNKSNRELMAMEAGVTAGSAVAGLKGETAALTATKTELAEVAEAAYEVYPFLNKNGEGFDETAINDVLELRNELIDVMKADGKPKYTPGQALQRAIDKLAPFHAARIAATATPPEGETAEQKTVREAREAAQRKKAAEVTRNQPAFVKGRTEEGGFKLDINKMSAKEMAALPQEVLDKLSGNIVDEKAV